MEIWLSLLLLQRTQVQFPAPRTQSQELDASGAQAPALMCTFSFRYALQKASKKLKGNKNEA